MNPNDPDRLTKGLDDVSGTSALSGAPSTSDATRTHQPADSCPDPSTPRTVIPQLPGYHIEGVLGRGGMGVVYQARQTELNRPVAIKMILGGKYTDPVAQARFLIEAEVIAAIQHPNVVQVYEFGRHDDQPFFVLEFVSGGTLAEKRTKAGRLTPRESAVLVTKLADGMAAAHQKGVVHRDLKPANVLLTEAGEPKITDFGLARMGQSEMTATGDVMGTPSYMSPEQAAGKTREIGTPADVYALGAILYNLITGRPPFKGESVMDTILQVQNREPLSPRSIEPRIPRDLETICLKCLQKDARKRYVTAAELGADLRAFLEGRPISARPVGAAERLWKWAKRNPAWSAGIAAAFVLLIASTIAGVVIRQRVLEQQNEIHANGLVERLLDANTNDVPTILRELEPYRRWANPRLLKEFEQADDKSRRKLHASVGLLAGQPPLAEGTRPHVDFLFSRMFDAEPKEMPVLLDSLEPHNEGLAAKLWAIVVSAEKGKISHRLRAGAALARFDRESKRWEKASGKIVEDLVSENPIFLGPWSEAYRPVRQALLAPLSVYFKDRSPEKSAERTLATNLLADHAAENPQVLADLLMEADEKQYARLFPLVEKRSVDCLAVLHAEMDKQVKVTAIKDKIVFETKGSIAEGDPKVKGSMPAKRYEVQLQRGKLYRLTMGSDELDSFLVLQDKAGKELAYDDDTGDGLDSLLSFTPSSDDTYAVFAAALRNQPTTKNNGSFHLKIVESFAGSSEAEDEKEQLAKRQANAAVALLRMNQPEKVWPVLKHSPDLRVRSHLIHKLGPLGADADAIIHRLDAEPDITIRRALILSLGEYGVKELPRDAREALLPKLQSIFRTDPDPGLHGAAEWLLRHWKQEGWLKQVNEEWAKDKQQRETRIESIRQEILESQEQPLASRGASAPGFSRWYVNGQGQAYTVIPGPVEFRMGSPPTEKDRYVYEVPHTRRIGRSFAIAAKSVTVREYRRFDPSYTFTERYAPEPDCPVVSVNWYQAAAYCNWLSEQEQIPQDQWVYEIKGATDIKLKADYLSLTGYRLPTEAEVECATRAGATTSRYYGETEELLGRYAWYAKNASDRTWPVGRKKPNELGLFDSQGNSFTWCQESYRAYPAGGVVEDREDELVINSTVLRVVRGGSFNYLPSSVRSSNRSSLVPTSRSSNFGFRPSRTLPH